MASHLTDDFVRSQTAAGRRYMIYWDADAPGYPETGVTGFGVRVMRTGYKAFIYDCRLRDGSGVARRYAIGRFPILNVATARKLAMRLRAQVELGDDPHAGKIAKRKEREQEASLTLHEKIASKFAFFLEQNIEPAGYLYRHYEPNGDLIYVGITKSLHERTANHLSTASWRNFIWMVIAEPFATREELLEAERVAIREEFPKFNRILNKHRHPVQELIREQKKPLTKREANRQRFKRVLARRAAAVPPDTTPDTTKPAP
jgi:predicted GIY-YIG superfamily endonuclease